MALVVTTPLQYMSNSVGELAARCACASTVVSPKITIRWLNFRNIAALLGLRVRPRGAGRLSCLSTVATAAASGQAVVVVCFTLLLPHDKKHGFPQRQVWSRTYLHVFP